MPKSTRIIDFHVHVFPNPMEKILPHVANTPLSPWVTEENIGMVRRLAKQWLGPFSQSVHRAQVFLRNLPEPARKGIEQMSGLAALPRLLMDCTPQDLSETMAEAGVTQALIIAHPPASTNEFVLEAAAENTSLIAAVNIPPDTENPGEQLRRYLSQGAKVLKIHAAADGKAESSQHYHELLRVAQEAAIPVILHTGCIHNALFYRDPELGHAQRFAPWFAEYPKIKFVLAHMNFHFPSVAMDLAEEYQNVYMDTSWQPPEIIGEAVTRVGSEKVLFGTDWPLVGDNMNVGLRRIHDCVETGTITQEDANRILGENAARLLGLDSSGTKKKNTKAAKTAVITP